jgi:O-antigen ligase
MIYNLLLLFCLYLPFQIALNPTAGVDLASIRVFVLILFFLWLAEGLRRKKLLIRADLQTGLVLTFLFINLISIFAARNTDWSWRKLLFLFSIFPIYFVATSILNSREKITKAVKFLVGGGAVVAVFGILQFILQFIIGLDATYKIWANYVAPPFLGKSFSEAVLLNPSWLVGVGGETFLRATANFPDPHMLSFYLGLLIPLALGLMLLEKKKKIIWLTVLAILLIADLLTFSRGGYLGLFVGALAMIIFFWNKLGSKYKLSAIFLTGAMVLFLIIPSPISQRFYSSFNLNEGSNAGRIATWKQAGDVIMGNAVIGTGIGNYPLAIKATADYREPIYAHNTYLDIAAETGILNGLVWTSLLLVIFLEFCQKGKKDSLFLMCAISVIIFSIHSLVETAIYSPTVLALFLIIISFSNLNLKNEKAG